MGAAGIELHRPIDAKTVEWAYKRAKHAQVAGWLGYGHQGMRAAKSRDPKLILCMEKSSEVLDAMSDAQLGQTRRSTGATRVEQAQQTPVAIVREAYKALDRGQPIDSFMWIYAAFGELAGVVVR